jgi:protein-arginine kinase activator protein McsA
MICQTCKATELMVDSVIQSGDTTKYVYVCMNPKCADYKKAFTLDGKEHEPRITTKE